MVLVGMFVEFDVVVTMVAFALEPMRLDRLVEVLLDCENRHKQLSLDSSVQVNMVSSTDMTHVFPTMALSSRGGRTVYGGRSRSLKRHV